MDKTTTETPLANPFLAGERIPWCTPGMAAYWAVQPATRWEAMRGATVSSWAGQTRSEHVLDLGTTLSLVAIWPCDDPNGLCGYWQGMESAHAFRVEDGPLAGQVVEVWGRQQDPPAGVTLLEPGAMISFTERVGFGLVSLQR
jgi:hypothetical protein